MKTTLLISFLWLMVGATKGLRCLRCDDYLFEGEPYRHHSDSSCFDNPSQVTEFEDCDPDEYCLTYFGLSDGLAEEVYRRCENPNYDHDSSTDSMPTHSECRTTIYSSSSSGTEVTYCYYACDNADNCNDDYTTKSLKICSTNCSRDLYPSQGYCDYLTGLCVCYDGFSGVDCSIVTTGSKLRRCVQCNSETDYNCDNPSANQGTTCGNDDDYCAESRTQTINERGQVLKTTVTRGCTSGSPGDISCKLSFPVDSLLYDYTEYTCTSICDSDNCNVGSPDDIVTNNRLYCVQCTSCSSYLPERTMCPVGSTHCFSKVEYFVSDNRDGTHQDVPSYSVISEVRGCATGEIGNAGCEKTAIEVSNLTRVTCQESCQEDGCNDGWPARPKCVQCSESSDLSYYSCLFSLKRDARRCNYPYQEFCYSSEERIESPDQVDGYAWAIKRDCSYKGVGTACTVTTIANMVVNQCNNTCTEDGCNIGVLSDATKILGRILTVATATLIASCVQGITR